jgi:hypothetical protein
MIYNLNTVNNVQELFNNRSNNTSSINNILNNLKLIEKAWNKDNKDNKDVYHIIKYDKQFINNDTVTTSGLFRSVIHKNGKILVFSPPKAMNEDMFMYRYHPANCIAEEFIEGTMINLFFDHENQEWEIASKSAIGAKNNFFVSDNNVNKTFRTMFLEVCNHVNLNFNRLNKNYCYSFVFQHPDNRIVVPFTNMNLYLCAAYHINNDNLTVTEISREELESLYFTETNVRFPKQFKFTNYYDLKSYYSNNIDYTHLGIIIKENATGMRMKFRNKNYEKVRMLKGNQPKLLYHYITLRNSDNINDYLKYYPEDKEKFNEYENKINTFINKLYNYYVSCYIKKHAPLTNYEFQYKNHMYKIHGIFCEKLRTQNKYVTIEVVKDYCKNLHPSQLMFSLNYHLRVKN